MSISGIASASASYLSQSLQQLLSQLSSVSGNADQASTQATPAAASSSGDPSTSNALTGSTTASLSAEIMQLLMQMQMQLQAQQQSGATGGSAPSTTTIQASSTASTPLNQLFSAIDSNGDGTISESELENFIEKNGGTQSEADQIYGALTQNGANPLTQTQLAQDMQQASPFAMGAMHGHHHHHHGGGGEGGGLQALENLVGNQLVQAIGGSSSTSISTSISATSIDQSQFESFVQALGGTQSEADTDFAAINTSGSGQIDAAQFTSAINAFATAAQNSAQIAASASGNPVLTLLDDSANALTAANNKNTTNVAA